jgi:hypothetical protein
MLLSINQPGRELIEEAAEFIKVFAHRPFTLSFCTGEMSQTSLCDCLAERAVQRYIWIPKTVAESIRTVEAFVTFGFDLLVV